jgi:hypothetical protein
MTLDLKMVASLRGKDSASKWRNRLKANKTVSFFLLFFQHSIQGEHDEYPSFSFQVAAQFRESFIHIRYRINDRVHIDESHASHRGISTCSTDFWKCFLQ